MSDVAIRVEGLGKRYQLGATKQSYTTLRDSLQTMATSGARRLLGRSERTEKQPPFWALKDVSFEIKRGEVVGIIGRNGAGKSTLLKILSRITEPTTGSADIYGRVGSLLEVGTGFHPELTGRETVYLNGAILGMGRAEINRKFDEIVAFAEVEKFIDTPVKHYSSGMYMRLAFAVAAHIETEILIVDEVLAVGDAQFQKKCLGKMGDVAKEGRTVLFVSHNMAAMAQLTGRVLLLDNGVIAFDGPTPQALMKYASATSGNDTFGTHYSSPILRHKSHITLARVRTSHPSGTHLCRQPIQFEFNLHLSDCTGGISFSIQICDQGGRPMCHMWLLDRNADFWRGPGIYRLTCSVADFRLYMGQYTLTTWLSDRQGNNLLESLTDICAFNVSMQGLAREYDWVGEAMAYWEEFDWSDIDKIADLDVHQHKV